MELFERAFEEYMSNYDMNVKQIRYKYHHSYKVEDLMEKLSKRLNLNDEETYIAKLIGLLHDIGRFDELKTIKRFDSLKFDHAMFASKLLFEEGFITKFVDTDKYNNIIKKAIENHNKMQIEDSRITTHAIK